MIRFLFFDFLIRQTIGVTKNVGINSRTKLMSMDFQYHLMICAPIFFFMAIVACGITYYEQNSFSITVKPIFNVFTFLLTSLILNKDFYGGQSVINRLKGYQVVYLETNLPANPLRCVIRNSTIIIWPLEIIMVLINPERRIGDFLANTKLVKVSPSQPESILEEIRNSHWKLLHYAAILFSAIIAFVISAIGNFF